MFFNDLYELSFIKIRETKLKGCSDTSGTNPKFLSNINGTGLDGYYQLYDFAFLVHDYDILF